MGRVVNPIMEGVDKGWKGGGMMRITKRQIDKLYLEYSYVVQRSLASLAPVFCPVVPCHATIQSSSHRTSNRPIDR